MAKRKIQEPQQGQRKRQRKCLRNAKETSPDMLTVQKLREELNKRGVKHTTSQRKPELVQLLKDCLADQNRTDPPTTSSSTSTSSSTARVADNAKEGATSTRLSLTPEELLQALEAYPAARENAAPFLETDPNTVRPPEKSTRIDLLSSGRKAHFTRELTSSFGCTPPHHIVDICGTWPILPGPAADQFPIPIPGLAEIDELYESIINAALFFGNPNTMLPPPRQPPSTSVESQGVPPPNRQSVHLEEAFYALHRRRTLQNGEALYRESVSSRIVNPAFERNDSFELTGTIRLAMPEGYRNNKFFPDTMVISQLLEDSPIVLVEVKPDGAEDFVVHHPDLGKMLVMMALSLSLRMQKWKWSPEAQESILLSTIFGVLFAGNRCHLLALRIKLRGSNSGKANYQLYRALCFNLSRLDEMICLHLMMRSIAEQYSMLRTPKSGTVDLQLTPGKTKSDSRNPSNTGGDDGGGGGDGGDGDGDGDGGDGKTTKKRVKGKEKAHNGNTGETSAKQSDAITKYSLTPVFGEPDILRGTCIQRGGQRKSVTAVTKKTDLRKVSNGIPDEVALLQQLGKLPTEYSRLYPRLIAWEYVDAGSKYMIVLETGIPIRDFIFSEALVLYDMPERVASLLPLFCDVAEALLCLHRQGYWHRDVKPNNIIVHSATGRAQLIDFNISRKQPTTTQYHCSESEFDSGPSSDLSPDPSPDQSPDQSPNMSPDQNPKERPNRFVSPAGTIGYIAPELYTAGAGFSTACDVYSLGICLLSLLLNTSTREIKGHDDIKKDVETERQFAFTVRQVLLDRLHASRDTENSHALSASSADVDHKQALCATKVHNLIELMVSTTAAQRPSMESVVTTLKSCAQS